MPILMGELTMSRNLNKVGETERVYCEAVTLMKTEVPLLEVYKGIEHAHLETARAFPCVDVAALYHFRRSLKDFLDIETLEKKVREQVEENSKQRRLF